MAFKIGSSRPDKYSNHKSLSPAEEAAGIWAERDGGYQKQAYNWRRIALGLLVAVIVTTIGLIVLAMKSSVEVHVVEIDSSQGVVKEVRDMGAVTDTNYNPQEAEIKYFLCEFIKNTREVGLDPVVRKTNWEKAYHFLTKDAAAKHTTIAQNEKVDEQFGKETVQVTINSVVPIENSTSFHVNWSEDIFYVGTGEKVINNMSGVFTVTHIPVKDEETVQINPLGIYISDFNYSKDNSVAGQKANQKPNSNNSNNVKK